MYALLCTQLAQTGGRQKAGAGWRLALVLLMFAGCTAAKSQPLPAPASSFSSVTTSQAAPSKRTTASFCASVTEVTNAECEALVQLYEQAAGAHWTTQQGWLNDPTPCTWHGVTCVDGRVDKLKLSDNGLRGTLPAALNGLRHLRQLYLNNNALRGPIPDTIGELSELHVLLLSHNQLSGPLPASLGKLHKLLVLYLDANQLSGSIPPSFGDLQEVRYLFLQGNQLQGAIPPTLGALYKLQDLHLYENQLQGPLPLTLAQLSDLQHVKLERNDASLCLPASMLTWAASRAIYEAPPGGICP